MNADKNQKAAGAAVLHGDVWEAQRMNDGREISTKRNADGAMPEPRYAYYRRRQKFRCNGAQCKAPALKGEILCYKHAMQAVTAERRERAVKSLGISGRIGSARDLQMAISKTAQALANGRLDVKAAAGLQAGALPTDLHR
jgi:hypothetical protein